MRRNTIVGAASLHYANAPEARLMGIEPLEGDLVEHHADALVAMLLPGLADRNLETHD